MPQPGRARQAGSAALERLHVSIDAAEVAFKDLRGEMTRDSRVLLKDLGHTLKDARRNLTRSRQRIVKDLEQLEQAVVKGKPARPAARKRPTATARTTTSQRSSGSGRASTSAKQPVSSAK